jgi:hypothetical protein
MGDLGLVGAKLGRLPHCLPEHCDLRDDRYGRLRAGVSIRVLPLKLPQRGLKIEQPPIDRSLGWDTPLPEMVLGGVLSPLCLDAERWFVGGNGVGRSEVGQEQSCARGHEIGLVQATEQPIPNELGTLVTARRTVVGDPQDGVLDLCAHLRWKRGKHGREVFSRRGQGIQKR